MTKPANTREIILGILWEITEEERYSHVVIRETLEKYQYLEKRDRAFISRVTEGTMENLIELDYILEQFSTVKVKDMQPFIRNLLRMSVYQLKYMDSVPDSAACNEAVKLAQKKGFYSLKGFVNAVLRNLSRTKDSLPMPPREIIKSFLSVKYSIPEWLVEKWIRVYGEEITERILKDFLRERPTTVRIIGIRRRYTWVTGCIAWRWRKPLTGRPLRAF